MSRSMLVPLAAVSFAIAADISGPVIGLVHDIRTASVRPVLGIPGAATLGQPLPQFTNVRAVATSSLLNYSLISHGEEHQHLSLVFPDGRVAAVTGLLAAADRIAISAEGRVAVVYSSHALMLQVIRGLPEQPTPSAAQPVDEPLDSLAVDDSGRILLAVTRDSRTAVSIGRPPEMHYVGDFEGPSTVGFTVSEAFIAVENSSELFAISDPDGAREVRLVADARDGINRPRALAGAEASLLVANSGANEIIIFKAPVAKPEAIIAVPVAPQGLFRLSASLFRLNSPGSGPMYLFDAQRSVPFFVPADSAAESQ